MLRSPTHRARSGAFDEDGHGLGDIDAEQLESLKFEREVSKHNVAVGAVARAVSDVHAHKVSGCWMQQGFLTACMQTDCVQLLCWCLNLQSYS